jgi:ice-binding like protein
MKANIKLGRSANLLSILSMSSALLLSSSVVNAAGRGDRGEFSLPGYYTTVPLGAATQFVILSQSGITDVPTSVVTGNVGVSPITGAADHLTCAEVTGMVYSVDAAGPQPCSIMKPTKLTNAVNDMQAAYTDAAGRAPTVLNLPEISAALHSLRASITGPRVSRFRATSRSTDPSMVCGYSRSPVISTYPAAWA